MKLKELKQCLKRFSSDFDDSEILLQMKNPETGKLEFDLLSATGHDKNMEFICFVGLEATLAQLEFPENKHFKGKKND